MQNSSSPEPCGLSNIVPFSGETITGGLSVGAWLRGHGDVRHSGSCSLSWVWTLHTEQDGSADFVLLVVDEHSALAGVETGMRWLYNRNH